VTGDGPSRAIAADELAARAAEHAGPDSFALVTREHSLMLRFAAGRPTQSTAIDDVTVEIAVPLGGHVGRAATNAIDDAALGECAGRARLAAEAAAVTGAGHFPGFDPDPEAVLVGDPLDPGTAELDPAAGAGALTAAFSVAEQQDVEAHGIWTVAE
jgi:predicted Zn-dependent protease